MWHKTGSMEYPARIELVNKHLLIQLLKYDTKLDAYDNANVHFWICTAAEKTVFLFVFFNLCVDKYVNIVTKIFLNLHSRCNIHWHGWISVFGIHHCATWNRNHASGRFSSGWVGFVIMRRKAKLIARPPIDMTRVSNMRSMVMKTFHLKLMKLFADIRASNLFLFFLSLYSVFFVNRKIFWLLS